MERKSCKSFTALHCGLWWCLAKFHRNGVTYFLADYYCLFPSNCIFTRFEWRSINTINITKVWKIKISTWKFKLVNSPPQTCKRPKKVLVISHLLFWPALIWQFFSEKKNSADSLLITKWLMKMCIFRGKKNFSSNYNIQFRSWAGLFLLQKWCQHIIV